MYRSRVRLIARQHMAVLLLHWCKYIDICYKQYLALRWCMYAIRYRFSAAAATSTYMLHAAAYDAAMYLRMRSLRACV